MPPSQPPRDRVTIGIPHFRLGPAEPAAESPSPGSVRGHGPPPRIFYGWVVLAASVAMLTMGSGAMFSLAIFLKPLEGEFGWSRSLISGIALANWFVLGIGSFLWGALSDRIGTRRVVSIGAATLGAAMLLSSLVTTAWQLYLAFGILGAVGASAFYVPLSATVTRWFAVRRGLVLGLLNAGMGLGILLVPPLTRLLISTLGWRMTFAVFGALTWSVAAVAIRHLHDRPADLGLVEHGAGPDPAELRGATSTAAGTAVGNALRHPAFWIIGVVNFACCAAHSGPIFHMVTHAIDLGVAKMTAASMLGLSGAASIPTRIASGLLADRLGAKFALVAMLTFQAVTLSTYLVATGPEALMGAALVFGAAYGGAMPLYAFVTREFFGDRVMGTAFGGIFFISCVGMGLGAYIGGLFYDLFGSYWRLHLTSTLIGAAAVALALALQRPEPARVTSRVFGP